MKKNIIKSVFGTIVLTFILLISYRCAEEFQNPYENNENVELTIKGFLVTECGGVFDTVSTPGANILILQRNLKSDQYDTIGNQLLNESGMLERFEILNSKMGATNIVLQINYRSYAPQFDTLDYMCCDDTISFLFNGGKCDDPVISEISCDSLDLILQEIKIVNKVGGCLKMGTDITGQTNNRREIPNYGNSIISVDLKPVLPASNKRFYCNTSPMPDNNGFVRLNKGNTLYLDFFVKTSETGNFDTTFVLPSLCTDSLGNNHAGSVSVKVSAEICPEDVCSCPFNGDPSQPENKDKSNLVVEVGTSKDFTNENIFTLTSDVIGNGCYLKVVEVRRYLSADPIGSITEEAIHDWTITSTFDPNQKYVANNSFQLSARFTPDRSGYSADTFEVRTVVFNESDVPNDTCSQFVRFNGYGCGSICPQLTKTNYMTAYYFNSPSDSVALKYGKQLTFSKDRMIKQSMTGTFGSLCVGSSGQEEPIRYKIEIPEDKDIEMCKPVNVSYRILSDGTTDDTRYFNAFWLTSTSSATVLYEGESSELAIEFNPPGIEYYVNNYDSIFNVRLLIETNNNSCNVQEIKLVAKVSQKEFKLSDLGILSAFSQLTNSASNRAYVTYNIGNYDSKTKKYGLISRWGNSVGSVDTDHSPHVPSLKVSDSFFFEVNEPERRDLEGLQNPENLSLVYSPVNPYSCITSSPVALFSNQVQFENNLPALMQQVFKKGSFQPMNLPTAPVISYIQSTDSINWKPRTTASEMYIDNSKRIKVKVGEVYLVWNPNQQPVSITGTNGTFSNYCQVAFIYINGFNNGSGEADKIGKTSFYVAYPLNIIKN